MPTVEIRCPVGAGKLLSKLRLAGVKPTYVEGNLIEFACDECKRNLRKEGQQVRRVLHRYNFLGQLVETVTEG